MKNLRLPFLLPLSALCTLCACVEVMPQADGSTKVRMGPGVMASASRTTQTEAANASTSSPMPPQSQTSVQVNAKGQAPDWTPMFRAMENECKDTPAFEQLRAAMTSTHQPKSVETKRFTSSFDVKKVPTAYRSAVGKTVSIRYDGDLMFDLPVTAGSYYGLPVRGIHAFEGIENGFVGYAVVLGVSPEVAKKRLAGVNFHARKSNDGCSSEAQAFVIPMKFNGKAMSAVMCEQSC